MKITRQVRDELSALLEAHDAYVASCGWQADTPGEAFDLGQTQNIRQSELNAVVGRLVEALNNPTKPKRSRPAKRRTKRGTRRPALVDVLGSEREDDSQPTQPTQPAQPSPRPT